VTRRISATNPSAVHKIAAGLLPLAVAVGDLETLPGNPRVGDVESVRRSLARFGQRKPVTSYRGTDGRQLVSAGNHTYAAAVAEGWTHLAVLPTDDDEATAKAWALADNRTHDVGTYDDNLLAAMILDVRDDADLFLATGYDEQDLDDLLASIAEPAPPSSFPAIDPETIAIEHRCPSCGYEWSGNPAPATGAPADLPADE